MFLKRILILLLTVAAMVAAYSINEYLKKIINPRRSFFHFVLLLLANVAVALALIILLSLLLFKFRNFFFSA